MNAHAVTASERRSRWIPWLFVAGFAIVVAANAIMIAFAIGSFTGLTTTEPYTKGLRFNDQIREAEAQEQLGWHVAARFRDTGGGRGTIELEVADRSGAALEGARVVASFSRPVDKSRDFTVELAALGGGRFSVGVEFPLAGVWDVKYRVARGGDVLNARDRLQVR
jgi:nitrogen fixation protein FixH